VQDFSATFTKSNNLFSSEAQDTKRAIKKEDLHLFQNQSDSSLSNNLGNQTWTN